MSDELKSHDFAIKAQKKILSKMASKNLSKMLIDEKTSEVLDEFFWIRKNQTSRKEAEKLMKNIIKVMIKVAVLQRNDKFTPEELKLVDKLQKLTKNTAMTIISFYEVDFTFDKYVLSKYINEGRAILQQLIASHLTEKSKSTVNSVFDILGDTEFLEELYNPDGKYRPALAKIAECLNGLIDKGVI